MDDFRLFGTEPGYPSKARLLSAAETVFGSLGFAVRVQYDELIVVARP